MRISKIKIILFASVIVLTGFVLVDYFGTRLVVEVNGGIYSFKKNKKTNIKYSADYGLRSEEISIKTPDNLDLKCLVVKSNTDVQKGTIILLHGIRGSKEHFYQLSKQLADSSFNSVLVDLRAHGESGGKYCTYGFYEKHDINNLVEFLTANKEINNNIGIWGQSLGAAVAIQSMGICPKIRFGIIESTFSDFDTIVHDYFKYYLGFDIPILSDYLIYRAKSIADFEPKDVKPYKYCKNILQPIIMAHGDMDDRIKIEYGEENYKNLASIKKEFITVSKANHVNLWEVGGQDYMRKVFRFIKRQSLKSECSTANMP